MNHITPEFLQQRWLVYSNWRIPYNPKLNDRAKQMRRDMTRAEKKLWFDFLKDYKHKFLRQRVIDNYIVDFYSSELNLVIELDWDSHYEDWVQEYDEERTNILEWYWLKVIRFTNDELYDSFEGVCDEVKEINIII